MPDQYESIRVEKHDRVTTVVLNRPERRNAVDGPMAGELANAFKEFEADRESIQINFKPFHKPFFR